MKGFRFRLESVLTLRQWEEERARTAYGQALQQERRFVDELRAIEQRIENDAATIRQTTTAGIHAGDRASRWRHLLALERQRAEIAQKLVTARRIREQKMKLLIDAHRRTGILDRLKLRQQQAHAATCARREQQEIDELVNARFQPDL